MVARLKLKEIDGRAPPGVNELQLAAANSTPDSGQCGMLVPQLTMSRSDTSNVRGTSKAPTTTLGDERPQARSQCCVMLQ